MRNYEAISSIIATSLLTVSDMAERRRLINLSTSFIILLRRRCGLPERVACSTVKSLTHALLLL